MDTTYYDAEDALFTYFQDYASTRGEHASQNILTFIQECQKATLNKEEILSLVHDSVNDECFMEYFNLKPEIENQAIQRLLNDIYEL